VNWEALGAAGELVGAAGVIASLLYLSVQIRQNTRATRAATLNAVTEAHHRELRWSSDISGPLLKAIHRPHELSEDDAYKVTEWMTASFMARENEFGQFREGLLEPDKWAQTKTVVRVTTGIPWVVTWWSEYGRHLYTPDFVAWVDQTMAEGSFETAAALKKVEGGSA
jgi:hypothetical protein